MSLTNLQVFNSFAKESLTETLQEQIQLFNASTQGGLVLKTAAMEGDFHEWTQWGIIDGLVKRRNPRTNGAVAALDLNEIAGRSVKVAAGTPPVNMPPSMFNWIKKNPEEGGVVYGTQLAEQRLLDMVNVAAGALIAATAEQGDMVHDGKAANASLSVLNTGASKFGDAASRISCWLMHSKNQFDLYGNALANAERLFQFGNVQVVSDGFGRPLVISDVDALVNIDDIGAGVHSYNILGLTAGAAVVEDNDDFYQNVEESNGTENIQRTIQSEWSYNLALKGYEWDKASGGAAPTDAALLTGSNWDQYVTSPKELGAALVQTR